MIHQNDNLLAGWIQHYACLANAIASYREFILNRPWRVHEFGALMHIAVDKGVISGDLDGNDDMDGANESLIKDFQKFVDLFGLPLKFIGKFDQKEYDTYNTNEYWVITSWYNPRTKFTHWVIGNKKPIFWDSIRGGSVTVAEGAPYPLQSDGTGGIRVFKRL